MSSDTVHGQRSREPVPTGEWISESIDTDAPGGSSEGRHRQALTVLIPPAPSLTPDDVDGLADLVHSPLVLTDAYFGPDRRRPGRRASVARRLHVLRQPLLRIEVLLAVAVAITLVSVALVLSGRLTFATQGSSAATRPVRAPVSGLPAGRARSAAPSSGSRAVTPAPPVAHTPPATAPAVVPVSVAPPVTATTTTTTPATVPTTAPAAAPVSVAPPADPSSPEAMGAAALALVRFPWQAIPGYSIRFLPIGDAPSAGFYGNTVFTWGQTGGVSSLYVFPGETVDQLAGITAFEIGHEVDAAYVEPRGGHDQVAAILGVHPASWAPQCDCAEQGYLSGWYAAAFSDYWSPGVGAWSSLAPPPSGAVLDAVRPWLDPSVP